ncbi:MAG: STAS domain-containing protein [Bacteroidota bacterium]
MNFEVRKNGTATIFKLKERQLNSSISAELKGEFLILCRPKLHDLIIDLSEVDFCDSSGLSALLIAERRMRDNGGVVKLVGLRKKVFDLIKISQLDRVFKIHSTVPEALKAS